jgi:hypothetical protein
VGSFALIGFLLAAVLVVSSAAKLRGRFGRDAAERSALAKVIRSSTSLVAFWRLAAAIELVLAVALVVLPARLGGLAGGAFFAAAAVYAGGALRLAPERPCGCFGASAEPASWRTVARALVLAAAAGLYAGSDTARSSAPADGRAWLVAGAFLAAFLLFSPEVRPLLERLSRVRGLPRCATSILELDVAVERVRRTKAWRTMEEYLVERDPSEAWREGCWQYLAFQAFLDGNVARVVFTLRAPPGRSTCSARLMRGLAGVEVRSTPAEHVRWPISAHLPLRRAKEPRGARYPAPTRGA